MNELVKTETFNRLAAAEEGGEFKVDFYVRTLDFFRMRSQEGVPLAVLPDRVWVADRFCLTQ